MPCCGGKKSDVVEPVPIKPETPESTKRKDSKIEYSITIKTGNHENSGTDGPVYIKIFDRGDKQTEDILLSNSSFSQDSETKVQIKAIDIGKPHRIIIRHEDEANGWFIDYVEISVNGFSIRFVANRWLNKSKHDGKLSAELFGSEQPAEDYDIEIQTGSEQIEPLDSPVYIQIYGTTAVTPKLFLEPKNTSFTKDSTAKFSVSNNHVGQIQRIIIGHENLGTVNDWYLKNVKIQTKTQQQEFTANKWLSPTKDDKRLFIELNRSASRPSSSSSSSSSSVVYLVTVQTVDVQPNETIENIEMSICGSNGRIDKMLLKDYVKSNKEQQLFQKGSSDQFEIKHKDIGNIENITIGFNDNEQKSAWLLESVDIKYKETVYHFRAQCWLSSRLGPNFNWITIQPDTNTDDINYNLIIETGESGIDANVIICMYGDNDTTTTNLALRTTKDGTQAKFDKNSHLEFDLKANDIGKITKINIGHDGKGNEQEWFLKSVKIEKNNEHYTFQADQWLNEEKGTFIDLLPEEPKLLSPRKNQAMYTITIVTSSEDDSGTDSGVFMIIYGEKDQTKQFQLLTKNQDSDSLFKQGTTNKFQMELDDVGNINKINIGQDSTGLHPDWHLETVQIEKGSEIYKFNADKILNLSTPYIDLIPILPDTGKTDTPRSIKPVKKEKKKETTYKVLVRYGTQQQTATDDEGNLYMIIFGTNGETKRMPFSKGDNDEIEFKGTDVEKILKIRLGQDETQHGIAWRIDNITIKRGDEITTFNVQRSIKPKDEIEFKPSPIRKTSVKTKDTDYQIKTSTGEKSFDGTILIRIRGEYGIISIPLSKPKSNEKPFRSKAVDEFSCRTIDVGKIKRITIEYNGTQDDNVWHLRKLQIIKGSEIYNFNANIRLDYHEQKVNLYPIDQKKEDYVQSELRRLRENLRSESSKMRRPSHKAHEPFVYNDLSPYFDTTTVEKAIHEPLETPPGYYTRLTALRIVEPWEAYGMDYGVNYELLKQRRNRGSSARRPTTRTDESIDRTQGSTHLPDFPCVTMEKPAEYQRPLTLNDVPKIRSFVRNRFANKANGQMEKDYKRTRDDFYRMQLDNVAGHQQKNRDNMLRVYHSYLDSTPGSKKALRELCDQIPLNATKTTAESTV